MYRHRKERRLALREHARKETKMKTNSTDVKTLVCCSCGGVTTGRQWHNRDLGYGLCGKCAKWIATRLTVKDMESYYGIKDINYFPEK